MYVGGFLSGGTPEPTSKKLCRGKKHSLGLLMFIAIRFCGLRILERVRFDI